jgi:transposase-like protein
MATKTPTNLLEAIRYFADLDVATDFAAKLRWPDGPVCPRCESKKNGYVKSRRVWQCKGCRKQFTVKLGTIMEDSPLGLDKWMAAIWMVANCKNGVSSHEMARSLGITQKSAWFMLHRVRLAMKTGTFKKLSGEVEADESFIGGRATIMHSRRRREKFGHSRNPFEGKTIVMGMLERDGRVVSQVVPSRHRDVVQRKIREAVLPGTSIYTDKMNGYQGIDAFSEYEHQVVDHAERYVEGRVHVNGLENYWSLLKRSLKGTYVSVNPTHLDRYLDEQAFRYNERHGEDSDRFVEVLSHAPGRRVTWKELTERV